MPVGNDVVDLHDPESQPEALHARFDARVFTFDERRALGASGSRHELRWILWAAKESAYKAAHKLSASVRFLPRDFSVQWVTAGRALVTHDTGLFDVRLNRTDEWVCAIATSTTADAGDGGDSVDCGIERLDVPDADPSRAVREGVRAALGPRMGLPSGQIRITKDGGIPVALWRDRRLPVDLSLSHHGRFVAWAWKRARRATPKDGARPDRGGGAFRVPPRRCGPVRGLRL